MDKEYWDKEAVAHKRPYEKRPETIPFGVIFSRWCQKYPLYDQHYQTTDHAVPFKLFYMLAEGMICTEAKERLNFIRASVVARLQTHADNRSDASAAMQEEIDEANGNIQYRR